MSERFMIGSGRCHGPGCERPASNHFCGESCWRSWHGQLADTTPGGATMLMSWPHPSHGLIEEPACGVHERAILAAVSALGMGCSGETFESMQCARCANEGKDLRTWLPSYVASRWSHPGEPLPANPQVGDNKRRSQVVERGWLSRWLHRVFGRTS